MSTTERLYRHALPHGRLVGDRDRELLQIASGRRVAHVGCTDAPITSARIAGGDLLHLQLRSVTGNLLGVDVDESGIDLLRSVAPGPYVAVDITRDASAIVEFAPEVVIASDVIEHVPDVGSFVRSLAEVVRAVTPAPEVVLTTPNLLGVRNVWHTAVGLEVVHDDHCLAFTPHTLTKLLRQGGFDEVRCDYYVIHTGASLPRRVYDAAALAFARVRHGFADGLLMTCRVR